MKRNDVKNCRTGGLSILSDKNISSTNVFVREELLL